MASLWRIELFGGLRLQRLPLHEPPASGAPILDRFRSRRASALVAFLSYFPRAHARQVLTELLWPDGDEQMSRAHLRVVLSSLRRDLEPDDVPSGSVLVADRNLVQLNFAAVTTDVGEFETALHAASKSEGAAKTALLAQAIELYGGALLPGFYDDWIVPEAQKQEEKFFAALHHLVVGLERAGDLETALHFARRGATISAVREDNARDLMRLYAAIGQIALAKRQFGELEHALKQSWNTSPALQTRELLRRLESEAQTRQVEVRVEALPVEPPATPQPKPDESDEDARLPPQWTRFFGRKPEIAEVRQAWEDGARLVTLSGIGGSGKTRLALEIAYRRAQESQEASRSLWFVALADVSDARLIAGEIAGSLRLPRPPLSAPLAQLTQALRAHGAPLLVLDNFEQLLPEGGALVQELLAHVPQLRLLVTSRRELGIVGEHLLPLSPLPTPRDDSSPAELLEVASVQLFHDRAKAARPDFRISKHNARAVARLCVHLEGLPLALELCAARSGTFSPSKMLVRLERRLDFLGAQTSEPASRHSTLRAALDWSFELLWPELQQFFARLGVFRSGFSASAAAAVAQEAHAGHFLEQLRAASLVVRDDAPNPPRFRLLETLREFADEKLDSREKEKAQRRHAQFYRELLDEEHAHVMAAEAGRRLESMARVRGEHDNVRAALRWSAHNEPELALPLVHLATAFEGNAGLEAHDLAEQVLQKTPDAPPNLISAVLGIAATHAQHRGDFERQRVLSERRLALARLRDNDVDAAWALFQLGCASEGQGDFGAAIEHFAQALSWFEKWQHEGPEARQNVAWTLNRLGQCEMNRGDLYAANTHFEQCAAAFASSDDTDGVASTLSQRGEVARRRGDFLAARRLFTESERLQHELGDTRPHPWRHFQRAHLQWDEGDFPGAQRGFERALQGFHAQNIVPEVVRSLWALGCIAMAQGDARRALFLLGCETAQRQQHAVFQLPDDRAPLEHALQNARDALGRDFETVYAQGKTLNLETAVALALRDAEVGL